MVTVVNSLLGWAALAVLERRLRQARTVFTALALAVLAASMIAIAIEGASHGTNLMLVLLHITVGATLVPGMLHTTTARVLSWPTQHRV